jgi:hypothetical protein
VHCIWDSDVLVVSVEGWGCKRDEQRLFSVFGRFGGAVETFGRVREEEVLGRGGIGCTSKMKIARCCGLGGPIRIPGCRAGRR